MARTIAVAIVFAACTTPAATTTTPTPTPATVLSTPGTNGPVYQDSTASVELRVADLLARMSLDEKIGQMTLVEKGSISPEEVTDYHIGALLSGGGGAPRPNTPDAWRDMVEEFQDAALATQLGIPVLYGVDAVHGHNNLRNAVIFPHNIGLGATRNAELVERIGRATAIETAATGIRWNYSPVLAVPQDIRWGRTYEAFGEDPSLVTALGAAMVRGLQGPDLTAADAVLATPKHFVGDGGTEWGTSTVYRIDQGVTTAEEAELRTVHLAPYPASFDAGAVTVMASFSSWENGKVHGDQYLLTDVLRDELGFGGLVVSDWGAVDQIDPGNYYDSIVQAINAGIDLVMVPTEFELFQTALGGAVEQGDVPLERIDEAVARILAVKFQMGLFEQPFGGADLVASIGSPEHRELARQSVAESVVVLETTPGLLPLDPSTRILLAGAAANDIGMQSGGWTISWQGSTGDITDGTTIFDALAAATSGELEFDLFGRSGERAPVGIAVVGETPYAEGRGDSETLELDRTALRVVTEMRDRVDRLIVILITGRPLILGPEFDDIDALLVAWLPGSEGAGVVDILFGGRPVRGTLPFTWPSSVETIGARDCGQIAYPFGYGLGLDGRPLADAVVCEGESS